MIRNIIFDLGGVLINLDVTKSIDAFKALIDPDKMQSDDSPVSAMDLLGGGDSQLVQRYMTGMVSTDEFVESILSVCRRGTTREDILQAWSAMLLDLPENRLDRIRRLKAKGFHVFILSNINDYHALCCRRIFKEVNLPELDGIFFSNEMHMAKPDARCYQMLLDATHIRPDETLYIDDLTQNIEAGARMGFQTLCALGDEWLPSVDSLLVSKL